MTQYGTRVRYSGDARIWLATGLLAVAGGTALAVFIVIVIISRGSHARAPRLVSGVIGAMAPPIIFGIPCELIVTPRNHPVIDPGLYRLLLSGGLLAIEITTLLLLRLPPMARLTQPASPQLTGQLAVSSVPGQVRPRRRLLAGAVCSAAVMALVTAGCSPAGRPASTTAKTPSPSWLCQPGQAADPCDSSLAVSAVTADGTVRPATWPSSAQASKFACFYVYPTWSLAKTANTSLAVTQVLAYDAMEQGAPLSQVCDVWAPVYRSQTFPSVLKGLKGDEQIMNSTFTVAYDSVLPAWQWFLAHTGGKPIILVGDSQGAAVLIHLISAQIDHQPSVLRRLLAAILVGGNLQVPSGKLAGATFTSVPLCTSATEIGCAIAFSSYPSQPPPDSLFGRPGQGTSLQSGQTAKTGQQVACVNPAAVSGGVADLGPYLPTVVATALGLKERVRTPWVTYPQLYSATCKQGGGATWLQVTSLAGTSHTRPVVNEDLIVDGAGGPAWGYHGYEYDLTLGNLLHDVADEEAAWESSH